MKPFHDNFGDTAIFSTWILEKDEFDIRTVSNGGVSECTGLYFPISFSS